MTVKYTKMQEAVLAALAVIGKDIPVREIHIAVYGNTHTGRHASNRTMQQKLGPMIARINAKLKHKKIVPGALKQTYTMSTVIPKDK